MDGQLFGPWGRLGRVLNFPSRSGAVSGVLWLQFSSGSDGYLPACPPPLTRRKGKTEEGFCSCGMNHSSRSPTMQGGCLLLAVLPVLRQTGFSQNKPVFHEPLKCSCLLSHFPVTDGQCDAEGCCLASHRRTQPSRPFSLPLHFPGEWQLCLS